VGNAWQYKRYSNSHNVTGGLLMDKQIIINYLTGMETLGVPIRDIAEKIKQKILFDYEQHVPIAYIVDILKVELKG
jgi:hypothetical protein